MGLSTKGLVSSVVAGCLTGLFYGDVAQAMFPDFAVPQPVTLSPLHGGILFLVGILLSNFLVNTLLMRRPFVGTPVACGDYFRDSSRDHLTGGLGGMIGCLGMLFQYSDVRQSEFGHQLRAGAGRHGSSRPLGYLRLAGVPGRAQSGSTLLNAMLVCCVIGIGLLIAAY